MRYNTIIIFYAYNKMRNYNGGEIAWEKIQEENQKKWRREREEKNLNLKEENNVLKKENNILKEEIKKLKSSLSYCKHLKSEVKFYENIYEQALVKYMHDYDFIKNNELKYKDVFKIDSDDEYEELDKKKI